MKKTFSNYEIMIVLALIFIIAAIISPKLIQSRKRLNESKAIGILRSFTSAQAIYVERSPTLQYGTLADLLRSRLINDELATSNYYGYQFQVTPDPNNPAFMFTALATPLSVHSGVHCFFVDQSGVIRFSKSPYENLAAAKASLPLCSCRPNYEPP